MTLHLGLSSHAHSRNAQQNQEVKEARRILKEKVRTDWDYPCLPAYQRRPAAAAAASPVSATAPVEQTSAGPNGDAVEEAERRIAGFRFHSPQSKAEAGDNELCAEGEPVDWREREYSSATTSTEDEGGKEQNSARSNATSKSKEPSSDWRFEGPDSVGQQITDRKKERKRKRDDALNLEMQWNEGLALFVARRNLWSGAKTSEQLQARTARREVPGENMEEGSESPSSGSTPRTSTSTVESAAAAAAGLVPTEQSSAGGKAPEGDDVTTAAGEVSPTSTTVTTATTSAAGAPETTPSTTPDLDPFHSPDSSTSKANSSNSPNSVIPQQQQHSNLLIPIAPPILVNHPVRRRINSSIYPEIYSKIILQSRTPSVPINLQTLMQALIQGWKDDGEWPPKAGPIEKSIGRKKGGEGALKHGVRAVGRVLRITSGNGGGGGDNGVIAAQ